MRIFIILALGLVVLTSCQGSRDVGVHAPDEVREDQPEGPVSDNVPDNPAEGAIRDQNLDTGAI